MKKKNTPQPPVTLIGAGSVGTAFAYGLHKQGYPIASIISKHKRSATALAKIVTCTTAGTSFSEISPVTEIIIITVPDASIAEADALLAKTCAGFLSKTLVIHTSGIHTASLLRHTSEQGARVAAVHPIQTFPKLSKHTSTPVSLEGIFFGVNCKRQVLSRVSELIKDLHGTMLFIPEKKKALYHAACVFSSSYVVTLANALRELSGSFGMPEDWFSVFQPLWNAALSNTLQHSAGKALTGPVVRYDTETLQAHLSALTKFAPELIPLYTVCGIEVARIAMNNGRISKQQYTALQQVFNNRTV